MNLAWGGPIIDYNSDDDDVSELDDDNNISKDLYIAKFCEFQQKTDSGLLKVVNADVNWLRQAWDKCEARYIEKEEALGVDIGDQLPLIQMAGMAPQASTDTIPRDLATWLDPDVYWVANIVTPFELIGETKGDLNVK